MLLQQELYTLGVGMIMDRLEIILGRHDLMDFHHQDQIPGNQWLKSQEEETSLVLKQVVHCGRGRKY